MDANNIRHLLKEWLFPGYCCLCGLPATGRFCFCARCLQSLPYNEPACETCATPLHATSAPCAACTRTPAKITRCIALLRYVFPADTMVLRLKSRNGLGLVTPLAELLADSARRRLPVPEAVIPVPLYRDRLRRRGFNPSRELARVLCQRWNVPLEDRLCIRQRATKPQQGLDRAARQRNIRGAFAVSGNTRYRHVALLDDVITTGSTIDALADTLCQAGVLRIDALCLARAHD